METNMIKYERSQFVNLYRQAARRTYECLPFGMKDEYGIDLISEILEMEDEYKIKMRIHGKPANPNAVNIYPKDIVSFIINRLNDHFVFPTSSDIKKILGSEPGQLVNMGICCKKVA
jgi:hypothetical protein